MVFSLWMAFIYLLLKASELLFERSKYMEQKFVEWVASLSKKYRQAQIKAAVRVNSELIAFHLELGEEINNSSFKKKYGSEFFKNLSNELTRELQNVKGFSPRNLAYIESFYVLYKKILQQVVAKFKTANQNDPKSEDISRKIVERLSMIPWGHHIVIINKCFKNPKKALFYINKTIENNWSRSVLLNFLDTDLYERQGKAVTNFETSLPVVGKDLANEIVKNPYNFDFLELQQKFTEKELKDALIHNIQKFLTELGTGFAYMGREFRLQVGETEQFLDMLFYNTKVHAYVVIEVKTTNFKPEYVGQLGTYVVAVDHILKTDRDDKTVGILICKGKDDVLARYALDSSSQALGVSSFELSKLIPEDFKSSLPTIEEIEEELKRK